MNTNDLLLKIKKLFKNQSKMDAYGDNIIFCNGWIFTHTFNGFMAVEFSTIQESFTIQADILLKFLEKNKNTDFDLQINDNKLVFTNDKQSATLIYKEYLGTSLDEMLPNDTLKEYNCGYDLENALYFALQNADKTSNFFSALTYIRLTGSNVEATDGKVFARFKLDSLHFDEDIYILAKGIDKMQPENFTKMIVGEEFVYFETEDIIYGVKRDVIDNPIDIERMLGDKLHDLKPIQFPEKMNDILNRVSKIEKDVLPRFSIKDNKAEIYYSGKLYKYKEEIEVQYDGALSFTVDPVILSQFRFNSDISIGEHIIKFENDKQTLITGIDRS